MNPKDQEDPSPDNGEDTTRPLNDLVSNLGNGLTRAGSAFKKWINFELPTDEFLPTVEERLAARERAKAQAEAAAAQAQAEREKAAIEQAAREQAAEEKRHKEALAAAHQAAHAARAATARPPSQAPASPAKLQDKTAPGNRIEPTLEAAARHPSIPVPPPQGKPAMAAPASRPATPSSAKPTVGAVPQTPVPASVTSASQQALARPASPARATNPSSPSTPAAKPPPFKTGKRPPSEEDLRERVADDHAWIRENLERRYRGRPTAATAPAPAPAAEPMDEGEIRARLLKIHGGRLPGKAGRQVAEPPASAASMLMPSSAPAPTLRQPMPPMASRPMPSQALSPLASPGLAPPLPQASVASPNAPAKPGIKAQRPVTSSKPRASVVKPAPASLRKVAVPASSPAQPALKPENPSPPTEPLVVPTAASAPPPAATLTRDPGAVEVIAIAAPPFLANETETPLKPLQLDPPAAENPSSPSILHHTTAETPVLEIQTPPTADEIPSSWLQAPTPRRAQPISARLGAPAKPAQPVMPTTVRPADAVRPVSKAPEMSGMDVPATTPTAPAEEAPQSVMDRSPSIPLPPAAVKPRIVLRPTTHPASPALSSDPIPPWQDLSDEPDGDSEIQLTGEPLTRDLLSDDFVARQSPIRRDWATYAPPLDLLQATGESRMPVDPSALADKARLIEEKLAEFRVKVDVRDAFAGPVITRYEVEPAVGVRGAQVVNLMKDLARALGVTSIRVVETIPGKTYMGLELPNVQRQMIRLSEVLSSAIFQDHPSKLAMALGKDITGEPIVADLAKAPHMLVAGTTGSGKSVGVNAMILSLLYRATPDEVRFVMIDPKMLELSVYDGIPHLLAPVVTDMKLAANALHWCVTEMERRYRLMSHLGVRNLAGFNQKIRDAEAAGRTLYDPEPLVPESPTPLSTLPFIVVVVDEFADLMMVAGKKIEELIARLAQKARAAGIHLILATQRPSVDVITGLIKANIPTRIAFQVSSKVDSRTILDQMGAETLLGQGDMLYLPPGTGYPQRVHGAFVADDEVHALAEHLKQYGAPDYVDAVLGAPPGSEAEEGSTVSNAEESDPLYDQAVAIVIESRRASISLVQRHLRIGYNRAARLVEQMETAGIVSAMESNGSRTVLAPSN